MRELLFLNTTHNLLTKFHMEKNNPFHLFNFLTWYEIKTYTGYTIWQVKFRLITWKLFLVLKWHMRHMAKVIRPPLASFCQGLLLVQVSTLYPLPLQSMLLKRPPRTKGLKVFYRCLIFSIKFSKTCDW